MKRKIIVDIEYGDGSYGASIESLPGCIALADSLPKLRKMMNEAVAMHLESLRKHNEEIPAEFCGDFELVYKMDTQGLIVAYSDVFTKPALSRMTGINEKQLWNYALGVKHPRVTQRVKIENALHDLGHELLTVRL